MIDTIVRQPSGGLGPSVREVCLVGSPRRTYVYTFSEAARAEGSARKTGDSGSRETSQVAS